MSNTKKIIIIGGGKGADLIIQYHRENIDFKYYNKECDICGIIDDFSSGERMGVPIIGTTSDLPNINKDYGIIISVSKDMEWRRKIYHVCEDLGFNFYNFNRSINQTLAYEVEIGKGNLIFPDVGFDYFSSVGDNNVISAGCIIAHHNHIGSGNLFGPSCMFSGSVVIGDNCNFGSGVIVEPGVNIGDNCYIASNTTVIKDVSEGTRIVAEFDIKQKEIYNGQRKVIKR